MSLQNFNFNSIAIVVTIHHHKFHVFYMPQLQHVELLYIINLEYTLRILSIYLCKLQSCFVVRCNHSKKPRQIVKSRLKSQNGHETIV